MGLPVSDNYLPGICNTWLLSVRSRSVVSNLFFPHLKSTCLSSFVHRAKKKKALKFTSLPFKNIFDLRIICISKFSGNVIGFGLVWARCPPTDTLAIAKGTGSFSIWVHDLLYLEWEFGDTSQTSCLAGRTI